MHVGYLRHICIRQPLWFRKKSKAETLSSKSLKFPSWWLRVSHETTISSHSWEKRIPSGGCAAPHLPGCGSSAQMGAIWGGRWQATAHLLLWEKSMLVLCQIVSISSEYSCFASDNPCCNTSPSDSTQKYALLFTLSCNSDYQGGCHGALKKKRKSWTQLFLLQGMSKEIISPCHGGVFHCKSKCVLALRQLPTGKTQRSAKRSSSRSWEQISAGLGFSTRTRRTAKLPPPHASTRAPAKGKCQNPLLLRDKSPPEKNFPSLLTYPNWKPEEQLSDLGYSFCLLTPLTSERDATTNASPLRKSFQTRNTKP